MSVVASSQSFLCKQDLRPTVAKRIVSDCSSANCFSITADETTDASTTEQISLCVRHVGINGDGALGVQESFTGTEVSSATGLALATTIKVKLHEFGIIIQAMIWL